MFDFLTKKFSGIFASLAGRDKLTEKNLQLVLQQIKDSLLESDVAYESVETFVDGVKKEVIGQRVIASLNPSEQFVKVVYDKALSFLGGQYQQEGFNFVVPSVIMVMGLQGSGKTTSIGKLACFILKQSQKHGKSRKILCASVDFYRPSAVEQLEIITGQVKVDFYRSPEQNPVAAARDIVRHYKQYGYDHLLFDTAGRLHVDDVMMQELQQIKKIVQPKYGFIVLDAMTGQESLNVARKFESAVGFDGAILSKMDSNASGGAAFSFRYELKKPIYFMGTGEKLEDLEVFRPERIAKRMLGMGDMLTLIEHAQEKIKESEQEKISKSIMSGNITLDDFAKQLNMMSKLGSLSSIMKFMPGMAGMKISDQDVKKGDVETKLFRAILSSMTQKERMRPEILDSSRKKRIALGAGVDVSSVNLLMQRFEQSKQFVKLLKKNHFFK